MCADEEDVEKWESMHDAMCASRAFSEPFGPLRGRALWQMGHSSSSLRGRWRGAGVCNGGWRLGDGWGCRDEDGIGGNRWWTWDG